MWNIGFLVIYSTQLLLLINIVLLLSLYQIIVMLQDSALVHIHLETIYFLVFLEYRFEPIHLCLINGGGAGEWSDGVPLGNIMTHDKW